MNKRKRRSISLHKVFILAARHYVDAQEVNFTLRGCCGRIDCASLDIGRSLNKVYPFVVAALCYDKAHKAFFQLYRQNTLDITGIYWWEGIAYEERLLALLLAAQYYKGKRIYIYI